MLILKTAGVNQNIVGCPPDGCCLASHQTTSLLHFQAPDHELHQESGFPSQRWWSSRDNQSTTWQLGQRAWGSLAVPESGAEQGHSYGQRSLPCHPSTHRDARGEQAETATTDGLTSFFLLQGVHAGKVAGQRLEGGGEAAPALGALHGAPRGAGAPQALQAHLGRRPTLPAVQDTRRLGGWGAATAALRGPGPCGGTLRGLAPASPTPSGPARTRLSRLPGASTLLGRGPEEGVATVTGGDAAARGEKAEVSPGGS